MTMYRKPEVQPEPSDDTRIPAWDPIIGYIIDVAKRWGPRPQFPTITPLVDEGADAVLHMARAYENIDRDYEFYQAVRAAMPEDRVVANKHGGTPGAPGYVEWMIGALTEFAEDSVNFQVGDYDGERNRIGGQVWFSDGGGGVDTIDIPVGQVTVERVVAAMRYLATKHKAFYQYPGGHQCSEHCNPGNCEVAHREHFGWDAVEAGAAFDHDNA